jgi:membrane associated rhomboid family serine protease
LIPLRDTVPSRRFPIVNYTLIGLCLAGFVLELSAGDQLEAFVREHGLVPARYFALRDRLGLLAPAIYTPFLTSVFLHGGWLHLLGNLLYLWIFGDNIEDRLGHLGYTVFYLAGGFFSGAAHVVIHPDSVIPTIGASGAIAAVMGAYFLLYPRARIMTLVVFFFWVEIVPIPAVIYLLVWFAMQLASGTLALATTGPQAGGVAFWAHTGGFAYGALIVILLGLRGRPHTPR